MNHDLHKILSERTPLHSDHMALWAPDLTDETLRAALLADPRVFGRIIDDLLMQRFGHMDPLPYDMTFPKAVALGFVCQQLSTSFLTDVGLKWHAPALALSLTDRATRSTFDSLSRDEMRACLRFRDHAPASLVDMPSDLAACEMAGAACLSAWMEDVPVAVADRIRLRLPALPVDDAMATSARITLFEAAIAEIDIDSGGIAA